MSFECDIFAKVVHSQQVGGARGTTNHSVSHTGRPQS